MSLTTANLWLYVVIFVVMASCHESSGYEFGPEMRDGYLLLENTRGVFEQMRFRWNPATPVMGVAEQERRLAILEENGRGFEAAGAFRGLSGAPAFDATGRLLGANSQLFYVARGPLFGITTVAALTHLQQEGKVLGPQKEALIAGSRSRWAVGGASVAILAAWGDITLGTAGRITYAIGDEFVGVGHPLEGHAGGEEMRAVFHAPVLANYLWSGEWGEAWTVDLGEPVGTVVWSGRAGVFGYLDRLPPSYHLVIATIAEKRGQIGDDLNVHVARSRTSAETVDTLKGCVEAALYAAGYKWADMRTMTVIRSRYDHETEGNSLRAGDACAGQLLEILESVAGFGTAGDEVLGLWRVRLNVGELPGR